MIKVGQIYSYDLENLFVVTNVDCNGQYIIWDDGSSSYRNIKINNVELIAEYPTWQDAVNSPEFRGEK